MKIYNLIALFVCLCFAKALANVSEEEGVTTTDEASDLEFTATTEVPTDENNQVILNEETVVQPLRQNPEIVICKDNVFPILKTIILAFTHKKDPTYKEVLKSGSTSLFKIAEKKAEGDKHMKSLLQILKKFVENYQVKDMADDEEEVLGQLAEDYLKKHKFRFLFPESLLLHQREMESFVKKKKELGELEGRQFQLDFSPYFSRLSELTSRVRTSLEKIPLFNNLNLDRIGNTFSSISSAVDNYIPALRNGAGIADLGISMGSLTALAAAGALISAPFFIGSFGASAREDEEEGFYTNRRVSPHHFPPHQYIMDPERDGQGTFQRPQWMENQNNRQDHKVEPYRPRVNQNYDEPTTFSNSLVPKPPPTSSHRGDETYTKYLNDYNQWLERYHNAIRVQQQSPNEEYEEYNRKYKEWYAQYYKEQFGEYPPEHQPTAPNAYEENNRISNMQPPSSNNFQTPPVHSKPEEDSEYSDFESMPQVALENTQNIIYAQEQPPPHPVSQPSHPEKESNSFQVIHLDEHNNKVPVVEEPEHDILPQPSALIGNPVPQSVSYNNPVPQSVSYGNPVPQSVSYSNPGPQSVSYGNPVPQSVSYSNPVPQSVSYGNPVPQSVSYNHLNSYNVSPSPVYTPKLPTEQTIPEQPFVQQKNPDYFEHGPSTESGFRPLGSPPHKVIVFRKRPEEDRPPKVEYPEERKTLDEDKNDQLFPSVKSVSIFKPPVQVIRNENINIPQPTQQPIITTTESPVLQFEFSSPVTEAKLESTTTTTTTTTTKLPPTTPFPALTGVTSGIFKTTGKPTPKSATTPHAYYKKRYNQSVRVVTSTSVVTSRPFVRGPSSQVSDPKPEVKKRKVTLTDLPKNRNSQMNQDQTFDDESNPEEKTITRRIDNHFEDERPENELEREVTSSPPHDVPVYALDPFYGPRLSRTDAIFHQLSLESENCREQVVCNMYKNPNAYTPLSDFLSRQLTVTFDQLKRPAVNDERVLRFFKYLQAARAGQDGFNCLEKYPECPTDTARLSYKPIVNAFNKVSVLMNTAS